MRTRILAHPGRTWVSRAAATAVLACSLLPAGCGTAPGIVFDPADGAFTWPAPPDPPRIRYVGQLRGEADLRPGKSGFQHIGETLFGAGATEVFISPMAVCTDHGQRVYVADSNARAIHVLDLGTREYRRLSPAGPDQPLGLPVALALHPDGRLLVSDSVAGHVAILDATGHRTGVIGDGALQRPCGLAVDPASHRLYVADAAAHQVVVFGDDGRELARIGRRGSQPGEFNYPTHLALDSTGRLYVSDSLNFRVQVFGLNFEPVMQIGRKGDMPGYFSQPKGIGLDSAGRLYVVDANFEAVQVFDHEGSLLMTFGREGQGPGEFWLPAGMCIDDSGRIWIADSYNRRVQVFEYLPEVNRP